MSPYEDQVQAKISDNSLLAVLGEIETELEMLPGTINDLQGKLMPVLKAEPDSPGETANEIKSISNNSAVYDRLIEILHRARRAKHRINEVTDRVQL